MFVQVRRVSLTRTARIVEGPTSALRLLNHPGVATTEYAFSQEIAQNDLTCGGLQAEEAGRVSMSSVSPGIPWYVPRIIVSS